MSTKAKVTDRPAVDEPVQGETSTPATAAGRADGQCVVDDGTPHMGRATPGAVICSAHAMRYRADGRPR